MKHHGIKTKKIPDGINNKLNTMRAGVRTTTKKELEIKTSVCSQYRLTKMDVMQKKDNTKQRQVCGAIDTSSWKKCKMIKLLDLQKPHLDFSI